MLQDTARDGRGVTHSMEQALELGDRTIMMHRGVILADLSGEERKQTTEPTCWSASRGCGTPWTRRR